MTATSDWLQEATQADIAFILWIDGLGLGYTTHPDVAGQAAAWSAATSGRFGPLLRGGLKVSGSIKRQIAFFDAKIQASNLTFQILDRRGDLFPLMFGQARTDIGKTFLAATVDANATDITVDDILQLSGDTIYVGLETMAVNAVDDVSNTLSVYRGQLSLFPNGGGVEWARTHSVPSKGGARPEVTDHAVKFLNRPVGFYVCHKVGGVWTAGFPGSTETDAELYWAGRIKHWGEAGDGWLRLDCAELLEVMQTSIGTRMFEGTLAEGAFFGDDDCHLEIKVTQFTGAVDLGGVDGETHTYSDIETVYFPTYEATLPLSGQLVSHQEAAAAINAAFSDAFVAHAEKYGQPGSQMAIFQNPFNPAGDLRYEIRFGIPADAIDTTHDVEIVVTLSVLCWQLLGFGTLAIGSLHHIFHLASVIGRTLGRTQLSPPIWSILAPALPRKFVVHAGNGPVNSLFAALEVTPTSDIPFATQEAIPSGFFGDTQGFLMIDEKAVIGVVQADPVGDLLTFSNRGPLRYLGWTLGFNDPGAAAKDTAEFIDAPDTDGKPVKVRQVWIEPQTLGGAMLRLLASTGTHGYNDGFDLLPLGLGVGFPDSLLDVSAWLGLGDIPYLLVVTEPTPAAKLIESALNLIGKHAVWAGGRLTVIAPFEAATEDELVDLTEANKAKPITADDAGKPTTDPVLLGRVNVELNPETVINRATLQYGRTLTGSWAVKITVNNEASQSDYDQQRYAAVDGYGIYDGDQDVAAGALAWAANVDATSLAYFSLPLALLERTFNFSLATILFAGSKIRVADLGMIDPATGERGVDGLLAWATSIDWDWQTGLGRIQGAFQPASAGSNDTLVPFSPSARVDETYDSGDATEIVPPDASDFAYTNSGLLTSGNASATAAPTIASITLPENALVLMDITNYHSTAASLAAGPGATFAGSGGETWVLVATTTTGGAAPNRRISRYRTMVDVDTVTVPAPTFGGAQTKVGWSVRWIGGVVTDGTWGADAVGQTWPGDTSGANAGALYVALTGADDARNGFAAAFYSGATVSGTPGTISPRTDWTEDSEVAIDGTNRLETQFLATTDTQANCTIATNVGPICALVTEVISNPFGCRRVFAAVGGGHPTETHTVPMITGRTYFFHMQDGSGTISSVTATKSKVGGTQNLNPVLEPSIGSVRIYSMDVPSTFDAGATSGNATIIVTHSGGSAYQCAVLEIWNTSGEIQRVAATMTGAGATQSFTLPGPLTSRNSGMVIIYREPSVSYTTIPSSGEAGQGGIRPGWRSAYRQDLNLGTTVAIAASWRANADSSPDMDRRSSVTSGGIAFEFAVVPRVYATSGTAGYDSPTQTLSFKPHEYTIEDQLVDVGFFVAGDLVHVVNLDPADPDAPEEWFTSLASVDIDNNQAVTVDDLTGWTGLGRYVMEFQGKASDTDDQRTRGAYIANRATRSTGVATRDANVWGAESIVIPHGTEPLEEDQPYRRINNAADDVGTAMSTHKIHEVCDFSNQALAVHLAPVYLNAVFPTPATHVANGATAVTLVGPVPLPLYPGSTRSLSISVIAAMATGTDGGATLRIMTSSSLPRDDEDFEEPAYVDGTQYVDIVIPETTAVAEYLATIDVPAVRPGPVDFCYLTADARMDDPANGQVKIWRVTVAEAA